MLTGVGMEQACATGRRLRESLAAGTPVALSGIARRLVPELAPGDARRGHRASDHRRDTTTSTSRGGPGGRRSRAPGPPRPDRPSCHLALAALRRGGEGAGRGRRHRLGHGVRLVGPPTAGPSHRCRAGDRGDPQDGSRRRTDVPLRGLGSLLGVRTSLERWARASGPHDVLLASPRSFCAGVERAIDIVERALERFGAPVYVRRQIVHNAHVVADLEAKGAIFVAELERCARRGHGRPGRARGLPSRPCGAAAERTGSDRDRRHLPTGGEGAP